MDAAPTPCHNTLYTTTAMTIRQFSLSFEIHFIVRWFTNYEGSFHSGFNTRGDVTVVRGEPIHLIPAFVVCGKIDTVFVINLWEFRFDVEVGPCVQCLHI